jgi:hypothetical protein
MKKITFLIAAILITFNLRTSAQFISGFGIKGGVTFSNQKLDYKSFNLNLDVKYITGFNGSIFAEFLNSKTVNLFAETGYDRRGFIFNIIRTDEFGNEIGQYDIKNATNYIFVSTGAKLKFLTKHFTPYILLGPRLNFYIGYNVTSSDESFVSYENPVLEDFKKIMLDLGAGFGIEFNRLLPYKTFIEANYYPGIITSYSNQYLDVWEHSINIKLGINFIKDKKKTR